MKITQYRHSMMHLLEGALIDLLVFFYFHVVHTKYLTIMGLQDTKSIVAVGKHLI